MPRNGSGGYSLPSGNPVVSGTTIDSTAFNNTMTDLGTAVAGSIAADGQTAWQGAQNANGNRIQSLGAASAPGDATTLYDVQTGRLTFLSAVAGTNTITAALGGLLGYTAGESFRFVAANTNTGTATLNINGLGALAITRMGFNLAAGDIAAGSMVAVAYDGTQFQLQTPPGGGVLIAVQVIGSTAVYTPTPGTRTAVVELCGGGGGGGGTLATGAGQLAAGSGGSAGGYAKLRAGVGSLSGATVTIGAGGTANTGAAGGNGGTTSFGSVFSATGGPGGSAGNLSASTVTTFNQAPTTAGTGVGGNIVNTAGGTGGFGLYTDSGNALGGYGGASAFGGGGGSSQVSNGSNAASIGAGGSGAASSPSNAARPGGAGGGGVCIVWEYA